VQQRNPSLTVSLGAVTRKPLMSIAMLPSCFYDNENFA